MSHQIEVVLVSNRGPVSFARTEEGFETRRGAGGLAGALDPVARRLGAGATWIAAATSASDRAAIEAGEAAKLEEQLGYPVRLLNIEPNAYARYYNDVSNRMLWFANHCLWDEVDVREFGDEELSAFNDAYDPVNRQFSHAAAETGGKGSFVLLQDYHLSTAPRHLRAMRPDQIISHFTHSSFCGPEGLEPLPDPVPRAIVEGMLGADLLGFHVNPWAVGFLRCAEAVGAKVDWGAGTVDHENRRTWVRCYPIQVDAKELQARAHKEQASAWARSFEEEITGPLVVRADRSEPSKNILRGFEAFGLLLDRREDLRGKARFLACLYPSRQDLREYRRYTQRLREVVQRVNYRHPGSINFILEDDYDRTLGAMLVYDVLLVNSIMDGMNLVSKEGVAVNERGGVLVLSKTAGSYEELGHHALTIEDPLSVEETAHVLERAIEMPAGERHRRAQALREIVTGHDLDMWIEAQLDDLRAIKDGGEPKTPAPRS